VEEAPFKYLIKVLIIKIKRIFRIRIAKKKPKKKIKRSCPRLLGKFKGVKKIEIKTERQDRSVKTLI